MKIFRFALVSITVLVAHCANISKEDSSGGDAGNNTTGGGTGGAASPAAGIYLADTVTEAPGHTGTGFYNSPSLTNGIHGAGSGAGATSGIFSLDNSGTSSHVVLRWDGKKVKNGSGIDFVVFENGFNISGNPATRFMDLVIVEVSNDNVSYCGFAPDYTNASETTYSNNPAHWSRFAGRTPVLYNQTSNDLNATQLFQDNDANYEPDLAGGDAFDLDQLSDSNYYATGCSTTLRDELRTNGFTYIRLVPANRRNNPDTGAVFVKDGISNGPDIDGVVARYTE
ncbi:MAG: LIC_13355 family lipoprotein [Spirochaetota bacterium]